MQTLQSQSSQNLGQAYVLAPLNSKMTILFFTNLSLSDFLFHRFRLKILERIQETASLQFRKI